MGYDGTANFLLGADSQFHPSEERMFTERKQRVGGNDLVPGSFDKNCISFVAGFLIKSLAIRVSHQLLKTVF